ncbi:S-adenosyl-L-methionine-dependent methyltransferase [Jimgerdemannia flammicorona]|uniref:S-adenosyl-L-methionine-dependent methyltransferase n=1 Tax=Jimgerdemannia flammicorona TaxID=994334 RepID=A0A433DIJ9_9FUNG|nr:S-adenosyl-L-methionine-dependent methyltransferase [Jimgerdemannia flammicorona]
MSDLFLALRKLFNNNKPQEAKGESGFTDSSLSVPNLEGTSGSVKSDTSHFKWMEGRRYNAAEGLAYILPSDPTEADRLMIEHFLLKEVFRGKNFHAPVHKLLLRGGRVLDVGCGPGIDISDGFPESIRPKNTTFVIGNVLDGLPYPDAFFDFVYMRAMVLAFTHNDWKNIMKELFRVVKPGGYVELVDVDMDAQRMGPETKAASERLYQGLQARGIVSKIVRKFPTLLRENGFIDPHGNFGSAPIWWGGKLGDAMGHAWEGAIIAMKPFYLSSLNYTSGQFDNLIATMKKENVANETYVNYYWAYAQRPLADANQ